MKMKVNFDNNIPIYIQLVEQLKLEIISEELLPGSRLLSVRELALAFQVNPNTMQKALIELERLNLIYTERTNGKYVTNDTKLIQKYKEEYASNLSRNYFSSMEKIGFTEEATIKYLKGLGGDHK